MTFTQLWPLYLGVAAAALPLTVHWLTRPRPRPFPISTLRFVREVVQQRQARHRLRDWLVLLLRTAAVLLLAWAVARPLLNNDVTVAAAPTALVKRVVILDVSQSMAATQSGIQSFERARSRAGEYLAYRPDLHANLILAGAAARPTFDRVSANLSALHEELARSQVTPQRLNVQGALAAAAQMLGTSSDADDPSEGERGELIIVSDFQRSNWTAADFSVVPAGTEIMLESVAAAEPPANLAILHAGVQGRPAQGEEMRIEADIANYSPLVQKVRCEIAIGDAAFVLEGSCPANGRITLAQDAPLPGSGWLGGMARLIDIDDALAADNARPFVVEVLPAATYALLTRQSPQDSSASSFYVERALVPERKGETRNAARVVRVDPAAADSQALVGCQLIVLDHPGKLSSQTIAQLAALLRRGRALLYIAAEPVDAINLKQLAESAGTSLQLPVEFLPSEASRPRRDLFLTEIKRDQAPFKILGDSVLGDVSTLRFGGGLASRRIDSALNDDLLAQFNDRSAALVISSSGAGALAVMNADLTESNLPASPLFVPLLQELVGRLLGQRRQAAEIPTGEAMAVYLPAEAGDVAGLTIVGGSSDDAPRGELIHEALGVVWRAAAAPAPGVYRVERDRQSVFALASEIPLEESDLRALPPQVVKERLAAERTVRYRSANDEPPLDQLWTWLAAGAVACMIVELGVLRAFKT